MKTLRFLLAALLLPAVMSVIAAPPAFACSCVISSDATLLQDSDTAVDEPVLVFIGKVIARRALDPPGRFVSTGDPVVWTFRVDRILKGDVAPRQQVISARSEASCGIRFQRGGRYVVFAYGNKDRPWTHLCTGTRRIRGTETPRSEIESPKGQVPPESGLDEFDDNARGGMLLLSLVPLGLGVALIVFYPRRLRHSEAHKE